MREYDWRSDVRARLASAKLAPQDESDLVEEVAQHLEDQFAELSLVMGALPARTQLLQQLRDQQFNEAAEYRKRRATPSRAAVWNTGTLWRDVRYGFRSLMRNPATLIAGTAALSLGIGLTTMMFSIVYGMLLKGLPFKNSGNIAAVYYLDPDRPEDGTMPLADFLQFRAQQHSFEALGAYQPRAVSLSDESGATRVNATRMTTGVFEVSGVRAQLGRTFVASDNEPGAAPGIIISNALWRDRYASDSSAIGKVLRVDGVQHSIIGVMPDKYSFPNGNQVWLPLTIAAGQLGLDKGPHLLVVGKIRNGSSYLNALAEFGTLTGPWRSELKGDVQWRAQVKPFVQSYIQPRIYSLLYAMLSAVFLVLIVACANVTNLLLNRAVKRTREVAIRTALGASRLAVIRQGLIESAILAAMASVAGTVMAQMGIFAFNRAIVDQERPFFVDIQLHPPVLLFVVAVAIVASMISGVLPALQSARLDVNAFLKDESHATSSIRSGRMSRLIVVAEIALSSALLLAAGFMTKSVVNMRNIRTGFNSASVYTAQVTPSSKEPRRQQQVLETIERELSAIPGNSAVYLGTSLPGTGWRNNQVTVQGHEYKTEKDRSFARTLAVTSGFFTTFDVRVLKGRPISTTDRLGSAPIAVVSEAFVKRNFPDADPIGQQIRLGESGGEGEWLTVVGVMPNLFAQSFQNPFPPEVVTSFWQQKVWPSAAIAVRGPDASNIAASIRKVVAATDTDAPVFQGAQMDDVLAKASWAPRVLGGMFVIFGIISLVLAAIGLYAVMAFSVSRRVREMGVRLALGASSGAVIRLVCRQGAWQIGIGMALGLVFGGVVIRLARAALYQVQPSDPAVFAIVTFVLGISAFVACIIPAVRATRVDPVIALRTD